MGGRSGRGGGRRGIEKLEGGLGGGRGGVEIGRGEDEEKEERIRRWRGGG